MLMLKRKLDERIVITLPDKRRITILVAEVERGAVRFGIDAPKDVRVDREEVDERRQADLFRGQQGDSASKL